MIGGRRLFGRGRERRRFDEGPGPGRGGSRLELPELPDGESARIVGVEGGREAAGRLESMGIIVGSTILKKSSALNGGPIVVESGGTNLAIGRGMASKVLVERLGS